MNPLLLAVSLACCGQFDPSDDFHCRGRLPLPPPRAMTWFPIDGPFDDEDCPFGCCAPRSRIRRPLPPADEGTLPARPPRNSESSRRPVQQFCPVTGERLGEMPEPIPARVLGRTILVCCEDCVETVERNPRYYLSRVDRELTIPPKANHRPVPSDRPEPATPSNRSVAPISPPLQGTKWNGQKTCPVTGEELGSMGPPIPVKIRGKTVWVCCQSCVSALQRNPDKYLDASPILNSQRKSQ